MKRHLLVFLVLSSLVQPTLLRAESETIDLKALAKKARPAVMLLVISDASGKEIATGTGFLVSADGKLITNFHVIEKAVSVDAKAENGDLFPVEGVLASDPKNDLVLLKLTKKIPPTMKDNPFRSVRSAQPLSNMPCLKLGKSENIEVGTRIAVIGSPLGLEGTFSEGIVSAVRELMGDMQVLQLTAAISPGSSGSPVINAKGDVIGIASAQLTGGQSLNLAVPVAYVSQLMEKIKLAATPQPFDKTTRTSGEDTTFADPAWRASCAAEAAGDNVELLKLAKVLVARYPDNAVAWYALGCAFGKLNFIDDAIAAHRQAVKIKPDYAVAWNNLGIAYGQSGRTDDEIAAHLQAIKFAPDDAEAWHNLGMAYGQSGRTADAIAACRQAIKITPDDAEAWYNLGVVYGQSRRTDDEIAAYRQAIKIKPDHATAWYNLGAVYGQTGRSEDAIAAYQQVIKITPDDAEAWYNLGRAYGKSGHRQEAAAANDRAKRLKPELFK